MHRETQLAIVAAFVGFLLKTSLGFGVCWAIGKVAVSARRRFLVWFAFLFLSAWYWLSLILSFAPHRLPIVSLPVHALTSLAPVAQWQVQPSWAFSLSIAERVLGTLYLVVLGNFLLMRIKKQMRLRWVLGFAYRAPDTIENMFRPIATRSGADRARLLVLSGIYSPATFGWIHPVILLPPLCLEQDERELADIFRHELQHVRRHDFFFNTVAGLCRALLFFHPAVWYAMRRLALESELACDLAVVRSSPERRATYAACLVRFARLHATQQPTPWNLDFAGSSIQLKVRIRSVLAETGKMPAWLLGLRALLGLLLLAGFLCMAPSLFVALSYANRAAQPIMPSLLNSRFTVRPRRSSIRRIQARENSVRTQPALEATKAVAAPDSQSVGSPEATSNARPELNTLSSGEPVPTLKQRSDGTRTGPSRAAQATVVLISNPSASSSGNRVITKGRSIASAAMTGAGEAARFVGGQHGVREAH
ncbi:MAG: M56 family metallopeptidase [Acidobacteriaceae bacterium]